MNNLVKFIVGVAVIIYITALILFIGENVGLRSGVFNAGKYGISESGFIEFYILLGLLPLIGILVYIYSKYAKSDEEKLIEILKKNMEEKNKNTRSKEM